MCGSNNKKGSTYPLLEKILFLCAPQSKCDTFFYGQDIYGIDLTWLDFDITQATYETQVISGCTGSQDFSWGGQLDQRTPETTPNYTLKDEGYC